MLAGAFCLFAGGCLHQEQVPPAIIPNRSDIPDPMNYSASAALPVTLYYLTSNGLALSPEMHTLTRSEGQDWAEAAIRRLCEPADDPKLTSPIAESLVFTGTELSGDICNVYFTCESTYSTRDLLVARCAIANTITQIEDISYVDIFINDVQPGYAGKSLALQTPVEQLDVFISNAQQEYEAFPGFSQAEVGIYNTKQIALYFTDKTESLLCSDARTISYERTSSVQNLIHILLDELNKGPLDTVSQKPLLPADMQLLSEPLIEAVDTSDRTTGKQQSASSQYFPASPAIIELNFTTPASKFDARLAYGSIVYTITGFCPNIQGVRILHDGDPVPALSQIIPGSSAVQHQSRDYFTRADFASLIGHAVTLAYPSSDGTALESKTQYVPQADAYRIQTRLHALFSDPANGTLNQFADFTSQDLLSAYVQGDLAVLNWRSGFMEKLTDWIQNASSTIPAANRERMFVYSAINTLAQIPGVTRVWMLEDGAQIHSSASLIHLGNALFYNPGLMVE